MRFSVLLAILVFASSCVTPRPRYEHVDEVVAYQAPVELLHQAPALANTQTSAPSFQFQCTTTAQRIQPPSGIKTYSSITVWNAACSSGTCATSSTPVFLGGLYDAYGARTTAVTTDTGMPVCSSTTGCIALGATYEVKNLECIVQTTPTFVTVQVTQ